jgi:hypothetical protein
MLIDRRIFRNRSIYIRDRDQHPDAAVNALCILDLIQIARRIIVYRRPQQVAQIFRAIASLHPLCRRSANLCQLLFGAGSKIWGETFVEHLCASEGG